MSSTNKTTNYNLSQFIGTDKPAWLSDYNGDMGKIDAGLNTAQNTATGADGKATANATAIGDLTTLTTTAKTNLVSAVNEVNTTAGTALNTAGTAAGNASQALNTANAIAAYLAITSFTDIPSNKVVASAGTVNSVNGLTLATNAAHSLGKLYGRIDFTSGSTASAHTITLNIDSGIHPAEEFQIQRAGLMNKTGASANQKLESVTYTFKPNGNIIISAWFDASSQYTIYLLPCLYFFENFGDES